MARIDKVKELFEGFFRSTSGQNLLRPEAGLKVGGRGEVSESDWEEAVEIYASSLREKRELVRNVYSEQPRFTSLQSGERRRGDILIEWRYAPQGVATVLELKLCGSRKDVAEKLQKEFRKILELQDDRLYEFEPCDGVSIEPEDVYSVVAVRRHNLDRTFVYQSATDLKSHIQEIATEVSRNLKKRPSWVLEEGVKILTYQHWFVAIV
jgi:hypothetical protein